MPDMVVRHRHVRERPSCPAHPRWQAGRAGL